MITDGRPTKVLEVLVTKGDKFTDQLTGPYVLIRLRKPGVDAGEWSRTPASTVSNECCVWNQQFQFPLPPPPYELEVAVYDSRFNNFFGQSVCNIGELSLGKPSRFVVELQVKAMKSGTPAPSRPTTIKRPVIHISAAIRMSDKPPLLTAPKPKLNPAFAIDGKRPLMITDRPTPSALYTMPGKCPLNTPMITAGPVKMLPPPAQYLTNPSQLPNKPSATGYSSTAASSAGHPAPTYSVGHSKMSLYD